jgi:galactose mutarotase-like enzyme
VITLLITIKNDKLSATVDTFGGELISCKDHNEVEYLWNGDPTFWIGRSPHLFPIIGTLKDNITRMEGKFYSMNKHGFARNSEFEVEEITDQSVTLVLKDNSFTKEVFPYTFSFYVIHTLLEQGFTTSYRIVNQSDNEMYCNVGGHVGVRCPLYPAEGFEDYEIVFDEKLTACAYLPPDDNPIGKELLVPLLQESDRLSLTYELFDQGAVIFDPMKSHSLKLWNKQQHHGVSFSYDDFPVLALWTFGKKKAPYLCLEPWHGMPAMVEDSIDFSEKPYIISIKPQQEKKLGYSMQINF